MADTSYGSRTLTAMFDTSAEAERAVERLRAAGIPDSSIRVTAGASNASDADRDTHQKGFFESLGDFFFPDEDRYTYAEGLARGGQIVTVSSFDEGMHDTIVDILDDEGSVDLEAREGEWRSSGWTGYEGSDRYDPAEYERGRSGLSPAAAGMGAATMAAGRMPARGTVYDDGMPDRDTTRVGEYQMAADMSGAGLTGAAVTRADDRADRGDYAPGIDSDLDDEDTVKVVEERLNVGKREVEGGRVRVRSYVREEPVSADVELRSTRVFLERRPVDRAVGAGDLDFQDRTIEAREHVEEVVVAKEARVVEEIGLRQESESHTETISDTVRKTEVEVEDERTGERTSASGKAGWTDERR